MDVETLTELLREAEEHHGPYEASAPKHHWSGFYAAYIVAREQGTPAGGGGPGRQTPHGQRPGQAGSGP